MPATRCACGFESRPDESVTDHLLTVFSPPDSVGTDGLVHEERAALTCSCGFRATFPADLDDHFLAAFTPADKIARDGQRHQPIPGAAEQALTDMAADTERLGLYEDDPAEVKAALRAAREKP